MVWWREVDTTPRRVDTVMGIDLKGAVMDSETPEADAAEQARLIDDDQDEETTIVPEEVPVDANPADLVEQQRDVPDDDPYDRG